MNDHRDLTRGWFLKGDSDFANARRTAESEGPYDTACFHVQQAIEKWLKGFLAFRNRPIPRTHDLEELASQCVDLEDNLELPIARLAELSDYAVQIRYDLDAWPTQDEARQALSEAARIRKTLSHRFPDGTLP